MIVSLFSVLMAAWMIFNPFSKGMSLNTTFISIAMITFATAFLFIIPTSIALSWAPLQKAEQNVTPRLLEMFRKDNHIRIVVTWLSLFSLITFIFILYLSQEFLPQAKILLAVWVVLLGISIDASRHLFKRILGYLNPFTTVNLFAHKAKQAIQNGKEQDLCQWIDGLSEMAIKSIQKHSFSLSYAAIHNQQQIARNFLQSSKSISHQTQDKQSKELGITDQVSYVMFYLYQRLELEFDSALKNKVEPICSQIIISLGKIAIDAAKYDISLASPPLSFLSKFAIAAQGKDLNETAVKASCTLVEVARSILNDVDIAYVEIKDPFISIVNGLEELAKGTFRKDRSMNIQLLKQPFLEIKQELISGKTKEHQDTPSIILVIDRVLDGFDALQMVMSTLPTIPNIAAEESLNPPPPTPSP